MILHMKIRFSHSLSTGEVVTFSVRVVASQISDRTLICRVPDRVRNLRFPPFGGKRYVYVPSNDSRFPILLD